MQLTTLIKIKNQKIPSIHTEKPLNQTPCKFTINKQNTSQYTQNKKETFFNKGKISTKKLQKILAVKYQKYHTKIRNETRKAKTKL